MWEHKLERLLPRVSLGYRRVAEIYLTDFDSFLDSLLMVLSTGLFPQSSAAAS